MPPPGAGANKKTYLVELRADFGPMEGNFDDVSGLLNDLGKDFKEFARGASRHIQTVNKDLKEMVGLLKESKRAGGPGGVVPGKPGPGGRPATPGPGVAPGAGGAGRSRSTSMGVAGMALTGAAIGGVAGMVLSNAKQAVAAAERYEEAQRYLPGMGTGTWPGSMSGMGIDVIRAAQMRTQAGRQMGGAGFTGAKGPEYWAMMAGMGSGVDFGQTAGFMGMERRGGITGEKQFRVMEKMYAKAISKGTGEALDKALMTDYLHGIQAISESQLSVLSTLSEEQLLQTAGLIDQFRRGTPGLDVTQSAGIMGRVQAGILRPGGGEAGQMLMLRAMGFGNPFAQQTGIEKKTYYGALKQQEKGLDVSNFRAVMEQTGVEYGGGEAQAMALKEIFGVSLTQAEMLQKMESDGKSTVEINKEIKRINEENKSPLEQMAKDSKKSVGLLQATASLTDELVGLGKDMSGFIQWYKALQIKMVSMQAIMTNILWDEFGMAGEDMAGKMARWRKEGGVRGFVGTVLQPGGEMDIGNIISDIMTPGFHERKRAREAPPKTTILTGGGEEISLPSGGLGEGERARRELETSRVVIAAVRASMSDSAVVTELASTKVVLEEIRDEGRENGRREMALPVVVDPRGLPPSAFE